MFLYKLERPGSRDWDDAVHVVVAASEADARMMHPSGTAKWVTEEPDWWDDWRHEFAPGWWDDGWPADDWVAPDVVKVTKLGVVSADCDPTPRVVSLHYIRD